MNLKPVSMILTAACFSLTLLSIPASAATAQQERMTDCNAAAKDKKLAGDARKAFMKSCLSGNELTVATGTIQQEKMKRCNVDANQQALKGNARKQFMSSCLKTK
ncbi:MAG: PsiF family protein [Steroidobacteraceae bacterium]